MTYDVSTINDAGKARLRQVAKICESYGKRVQNSVFECYVNESQYRMMTHQLDVVIDKKQDSLRYYSLGNSYATKVVHVGIKPSTAPDDIL